MATSFLQSLPSVLRTVFRRVVFVVETPFMYLFGRDIFISYARSDAATYAQQLAIAVRGEVPKLSFFLDQWASLSGRTLPLSLRLALRWSQMLVFVGTKNAIDSTYVRMELQAFSNRRGRFVPIDVGGALGQAIGNDEFLSAVCGPGAVHETGTNVESGTPSKSVVTRVVNAVTFTRQDRRLRRAVVATTIGIAAIIATAFFASRSIISNAQAQAQEANRQARDANDQRQKALEDLKHAQIATEQAKGERTIAEQLAKQAKEEAELAETLRVEAEQLRDQARAEATRQGEIATSRLLANQSELTLRRNPTRLADSVSLAVESMDRAHAIGFRSLEADRALRASLSLLPRSLGPSRPIDSEITASGFSPDGKYLALLCLRVTLDEQLQLRVLRVADGQEVAASVQTGQFIAVSNDARRVSTSIERTIHTREISGSGKWELKIENEDDFITGLALSPDGKYLALMMTNADTYDRSGFSEIWEVESGKKVVRLDTGRLQMKSIAFSANGRLLTIAGLGDGPTGQPLGRALVWDRKQFASNELKRNDFRDPDELFQTEPIEVIAVGRDERFVATAVDQMAVVWKKTNVSGYQEIARMPVEGRIKGLAFSSDGRQLHVLTDTKCRPLPCKPRSLETWESMGYWRTINTPHDNDIESLAFQPGDEAITTISSGYADVSLQVWRAADGEEMKDATRGVSETDSLEARSATPDARYVIAKNTDGWHVWDVLLRTKIPISIDEVETDRLDFASLTPDGTLVSFVGRRTGSREHLAVIYKRDGPSYELFRSFPLPIYPNGAAMSPDKNYIVLPTEKGLKMIGINDRQDRTPPQMAKLTSVESLEFSPDSKTLAVLVHEELVSVPVLSIWRLHDGRKMAMTANTEPTLNYSFNATGDYLVAAGGDTKITLIKVRTGDVKEISASGAITIALFSPDGQFVSAADTSGLVRLIELSTGDEVMHFLHDDAVTKIAFSRDGKYLATATKVGYADRAYENEAHRLHVWLLRPKDLIKEACERLARFRTQPLSYCAMR